MTVSVSQAPLPFVRRAVLENTRLLSSGLFRNQYCHLQQSSCEESGDEEFEMSADLNRPKRLLNPTNRLTVSVCTAVTWSKPEAAVKYHINNIPRTAWGQFMKQWLFEISQKAKSLWNLKLFTKELRCLFLHKVMQTFHTLLKYSLLRSTV